MSELGTEAFWSAVVGVASVLALTLVLEARYTIANARLRLGSGARTGVACYLIGAEVLVFAALMSALMRLDNLEAAAMSPTGALIVLTLAFALAVFVPLVLAFATPPESPRVDGA